MLSRLFSVLTCRIMPQQFLRVAVLPLAFGLKGRGLPLFLATLPFFAELFLPLFPMARFLVLDELVAGFGEVENVLLVDDIVSFCERVVRGYVVLQRKRNRMMWVMAK
jgi:hypothetical protein